MLLRRGRDRPLTLPQGGQLSGRDGFPVRLDESRLRAWIDPPDPPGLALSWCRVRRWRPHDRDPGAAVSLDAVAPVRRRGATPGGARPARTDGRPRRDGYVDERGILRSAAYFPSGADDHQPLLLDGRDLGLDRHRARFADRRRAGG